MSVHKVTAQIGLAQLRLLVQGKPVTIRFKDYAKEVEITMTREAQISADFADILGRVNLKGH